MAKKYQKFSPAFTLVEVMLVVGMVAVVALAVTGIVYSAYQDWQVVSQRSNVLQDGQAAIDFMVRTLRQAKEFTAISGPAAPAGFITFTSVDDITEEFRLNTGAGELEYGQPGSLSALTGPVNSLTFTYYDIEGNALNPTDLADIRSINIQAEFADAEDPSLTFTLSGRVFVPTDDPAPPCLLAWWKLNDGFGLTATDSSVNGYDGSLENMDGTEWTAGILGGALQFDGNNDYIGGIGDCPTGNYTVATWAKDTGTTGDGWSVLYSAEQEIWFGVDHEASPVVWLDAGGNGNGANLAAGTWTRDVWHHIAATWDGSNLHLYLDGIDMPITVYGTPGNALATAAVIGAYSQNPTTETWYGEIDDVRLYNCALDPADIAELADVLIYREFTEAKAASDATSITIDTPSGVSEGDLLIAAVATDGDTSSSLAPPGGEGWTEIDIDDYSSEATLATWWKNADASESPTHEFSWSPDQQAYGWMMRFTGHDSSDPVNFWAAGGESSSTPTSPAVVTTVDNCLILRLGAFDDSDITEDNPGLSGHSVITMDASASSGGQVTYRQFTEAKLSSNGTSITVSTPAGTAEGDLLIAAVVTDAQETISPPGGQGWTQIAHDRNSMTLGLWWKNAGASESPNHQFTWSTNEQAYAWMMRFTGHDSAGPINTSQVAQGTSSSPTSPSVTTTVADCLILRIGGFDDDDITADSTGLSGHTDITMDKSNSGNGTCAGGAGFVQQPAIGDSGTSTFSLSANEQYRTVTIAIAPDTSAPVVGAVSGGAGYVSQADAGDSGTSTFALTASQEARTLTIAIAPAP